MAERIIPWWRKALSYAVNGIRSLLGGGRTKDAPTSESTTGRNEEPEVEVNLTEPEPRFEVAGEAETDEDWAAVPEVAEAVSEAIEKTSVPPDPVSEIEEQTASVTELEKEWEIAAPIEEPVKEVVRGEVVRGEVVRGEVVRGEVVRGEVVRGEVVRGEAVRGEAVCEAEAVDDTVPAAAGAPEDSEVKLELKPEAEARAVPAQQTIAEVKAILEAVIEVEAEALAASAVFAVMATEEEPGAISTMEKAELAAQKVMPEMTAADAEAHRIADVATADEPQEFVSVPVVQADPTVEPFAVPAAEAAEPGLTANPAPPATETTATVSAKTEAEQKTAARVAAAIKAREESADPSPFSVFVGQVYEGPLDLLLDLIRKQDIDIYDIPIARITAQFLAYVNQLKASDMDVAGEFIYTASLLIHIKSKMLLPRTALGPEDAAEDPRRELVERLLEHERFKNAAQMLQQKQMLEAATWTNPGVREFREDTGAEPEIAADTTDLVRVFQEILERARNRPIINVEEDSVTVGQMIQFLARRLMMEDKPVALRKLLSHTRSERALIAMFLALLELVRLQAILLRQDRHFGEIFIKKHSGFEAAMEQGLASARDDWR